MEVSSSGVERSQAQSEIVLLGKALFQRGMAESILVWEEEDRVNRAVREEERMAPATANPIPEVPSMRRM
jgi:hypothetical protein